MFDIGFTELMVIAVVALVVIGPERLPKVARTAGHLFGRLQRYVSDIKADINREIQLEELKKLQEDIIAKSRAMEHSMTEQFRSVETSVNESIEQGIGPQPGLPGAPPPAAADPMANSGAVAAAASTTPAAEANTAAALPTPAPGVNPWWADTAKEK